MADKDLRSFWTAARSMQRREFLKWTATGAVGAQLAPLAAWVDQAAAQSSGGELILATWGGSYQEAQRKHLFAPFEAATGIKIVDVSPFSYGKLKSMVEAGQPEWDVTIVSDVGQAKRAMNDGLTEAIDWSAVNGADLFEQVHGSHWVAGDVQAVVMAYHKEAFPGQHPTNWREFWDVATFPGTRAMHNWCVTTYEAALLADGVAAKDLYPIDRARALASLDKIKPHVKVWWDLWAQATSQQLLKDREVDLLNMWTGRIGPMIIAGDPVGMDYGESLLSYAPWVVVKGAKNVTNAWKFLDFVSRAEPQASLYSELTYGPTNKNAFSLIKPDVAKLLPSYPENLAKSVEINTEYWQENEAAVTEEFTAWLLA